MSDKYNERVQALAEELLRTFKGYKQDTPIGTWEWAFYKDEYTGYARVVVNHMAKLAEKIFTGAYYDESLSDVLKWEGLIPDSAQEEVKIGTMQPGDRGGIHNPDNPEPCPQELRCHTRNHPEGPCDCQNMGLLPVNEGDCWPPAKGMENKPLDTTGKYFNVQCQKCGWTGSSEHLDGGGQIADTGDYGDTYCPNCGQIDPDDYTPDQEGGQNG
jgi:hypothetical protein